MQLNQLKNTNVKKGSVTFSVFFSLTTISVVSGPEKQLEDSENKEDIRVLFHAFDTDLIPCFQSASLVRTDLQSS